MAGSLARIQASMQQSKSSASMGKILAMKGGEKAIVVYLRELDDAIVLVGHGTKYRSAEEKKSMNLTSVRTGSGKFLNKTPCYYHTWKRKCPFCKMANNNNENDVESFEMFAIDTAVFNKEEGKWRHCIMLEKSNTASPMENLLTRTTEKRSIMGRAFDLRRKKDMKSYEMGICEEEGELPELPASFYPFTDEQILAILAEAKCPEMLISGEDDDEDDERGTPIDIPATKSKATRTFTPADMEVAEDEEQEAPATTKVAKSKAKSAPTETTGENTELAVSAPMFRVKPAKAS
jgi:hypothetical protein